ncbi:putative transposase [Cytobacillus oceanisediminis]|uniref:Putative transposase n=1 Tax=Cytobacillus oceanisediminis TaxID=665099 RepID=A0A2V2ZQK5_9BACI|nr:Mu transposase C-terminal domain-containing protein [Cytobacillus oceanisediminis]PWW26621.1 putative transposase [Cytobacillus oceanisediminis]
MSSRVHIARGTKFILNGRKFEISQEIGGENYLAKDLDFKDVEEKFSLNDLLYQLEQGNLEFLTRGSINKNGKAASPDYSDFSLYPEKLQERAKFRLHAIKPLLGIQVKSLNPYVLSRVNELKASGYEVSRASIFRWLKAYQESEEDIRSLVSNITKCGPQDNKLQKEVDLIINQVIDKHYLVREEISVKTIYRLVYHQIDKENEQRDNQEKLSHPSISTIRRRIGSRDSFEVDKARKGMNAIRNKYMEVTRQNKPTYPLQRVECDHTTLDLEVLDDTTLLPIGRPTITSLLDVYTGYPLGVYIGFEPPSYTSVMYALLHAISPKTYLKSKYPRVKNEWSAYGLPELLVMDNGKEFRSKHLEEACLQLGIERYYCPVKMPWYKGAVERHFRTINQQLIHQSPGTTFSNTVKKGDYDSTKKASIRFNKLLEIFHKWLIDEYAQEYNSGVRGVPAVLWEKAFEHSPKPAVPSTKLDWKVALMKLGFGSIQRTGVRRLHLFYQSPELSLLKGKLRAKGKENRVKFKLDPTDLSMIYVYDEIDNKYIEVPCTDEEYSRGLNEYAHRVILEKANEDSKKVDKSALAAARAELVEMMQEEKNFSLKERKKNARIEGKGSDKELTDEPAKPNLKVVVNQKKNESKKENLDLLGIDIDNDWGHFDAN